MNTNMTKHPLRAAADALRKAFALDGFCLYDNGEYPELEKTEINIQMFENPSAFHKAVLLQEGQYALRTQLLLFAVAKMRECSGPELKAVATGTVFDGDDEKYPAHLLMEGIISVEMSFFDVQVMWNHIVRNAFGAACRTDLVKVEKDQKKADMSAWGTNAMKDTTLLEPETWEIRVTEAGNETFTLGYTGTMTWLGSALLAREEHQLDNYAFSIDVDLVACRMFHLDKRDQLFRNAKTYLDSCMDGSTSASPSFEDVCRDELRIMGYTEGFGPKMYPDGIYKKMNMIQDQWDLNNRGVLLKEALGESVGLPTVLTPALEQILSEKWNAGETSAKVFETGHIFVPQKGGAPIEKLALSFGAYGPDVDLNSFTKEVGDFLTGIGVKNHFYIPTDMAIAYNVRECKLILDEKLNYLGGNFGGISEVAEKNFEIGTHAFMANLELRPLEEKAREEYGFVAPELR